MYRKGLLQSKRGGFAMATVLYAVVILLVIGTGVLTFGLHGRGFAVRTSSEIAARGAADAGLTKALLEMNKQLELKTWNDSSLPSVTNEPLPNCDSSFSYQVVKDVDNVYTIESIGKYSLVQRTVNCTLELQGLFEGAIFVVETIDMKNNNMVVGYNSTTGETNIPTQIGTLSTEPGSITLGGSTITGDIVVGVGGDPGTIVQTEGEVTGEIYAASEEYDLPTIIPPALPDKGTIDVSGTTVISPADSGRYTSITAASDVDILEIDGGDVVLHITGNINMDNFSEIRINEGSSLTVYVDGDMTFVNGAGINNPSGLCSNFKVYGTGTSTQTFELKNNSEVFGAIYAPNADVILKNNAVLHGSVTAKSFTILNNGTFYYDAALSDVDITDVGVRFVVDRWFEE